MKNALEFYEDRLLPEYTKWINDRVGQDKVRNVIAALDEMADWLYKSIPGEKARAGSVSNYRDLVTQVLPDYGLIRDIADGTKHMSLDRPKRRVTHASQIKETGYCRFDEVRDVGALSDWGGLAEWGVTEDNGTWTPLAPVIEQMKAFWEKKLETAYPQLQA